MADRLPIATEAVEDLGGEFDEVTNKGAKAKAAIDGIKTSVQALADPVFRAEQATAAFERVREEVTDDMVITGEEALELGEAYGSMTEAEAAVTGANVVAAGDLIDGALRRVDAQVDITDAKLRGLPGAAAAGFDATERAFRRLIENPIRIEVVATLPPRDAFDRAVANAISSATRDGSFNSFGPK